MNKSFPYVTLSKDASILAATTLRAESHESLACHAANLTVELAKVIRVLRMIDNCLADSEGGTTLGSYEMGQVRALLYFHPAEEPTDPEYDGHLSDSERHEYDPIHPDDMEDDLRERSENIGVARDAAFERGRDDYRPGLDITQVCPYEIGQFRQDYCDGWLTARSEAGVALACATEI